MNQYPSCFPDDFEQKILPQNVHLSKKEVYRVMKKGYIDREGFFSTYEEIMRGLIPPGDKLKRPNDPSLYSTSCNMELSDAQYILGILSGHHPAPVIVHGTIHPECGPWQLTSERTGRTDSHVDWWVYDKAEPQMYFREVKGNET